MYIEDPFNLAFDFTVSNEGGYSNHADDLGKETYMGISRYYNPRWDGWNIIDEKRKENDFPKNLSHAVGLTENVKSYYRIHYWEVMNCDKIDIDEISIKLFDMAVSLGTRKAGEYLQECLFVLNGDIVVDGICGKHTVKALNDALSYQGNDKRIEDMLYSYHTIHYINLCLKRPKQRVFIRGWMSRSNRRYRRIYRT